VKTIFLSWLPWALVGVLAVALTAALVTLAYLFSFLMSGAWYRWKHKSALSERDTLSAVRQILEHYESTHDKRLPGADCANAIALIDKELSP
jgi:hypothetical protein